MKRRNFFRLASASALVAITPSVFGRGKKQAINNKKSLVNPFDTKGQWYKSALHLHTTNSDGDVDVPTRLKQYRDLGYDVVAVTDHRTTNDLSGYVDTDFLPLSSIEFHPKTYSGAPTHHFLAYGLPHPYKYQKNLPAQEMIDDIKSKGAKVFYAHPYWTGHTFEEMTEVSGYLGLEVYNDGCKGRNSAHAEVYWDQLLNKGHVVSGIATDDLHRSAEINQAWTMIKAKSLNEKGILDALEKGSFYGTMGPEIKDFRVDKDGNAIVECSPVEKIAFRVNDAGNGNVFTAGEGSSLGRGEWNIKKKNPKWIRVEITDKDGKMAWANPIFL